MVMANLRDAVVDYLHLRPVLVDMTDFIAAKARSPEIRRAAEAIASRMRHQRLQYKGNIPVTHGFSAAMHASRTR